MNLSASLFSASMPMLRPFSHSLAERATAESVFFSLSDGEFTGMGEGLPRRYVTGETIETAMRALSCLDIGRLSENLDWTSFPAFVARLEALDLAGNLASGLRLPAAAAAVELAALDLAGRRFSAPLSRVAGYLGLRSGIARSNPGPFPISRVLDFNPDPAALSALGSARHVKIKVGADFEADSAMLRAVRATMGAEATLSVDANQAWSFGEAVRRTKVWESFRIDWFEEPLIGGSWAELARLRAETGMRVMLDEAAAPPKADREQDYLKACDCINIRISRCGGLIAAMRQADWAVERGLGFQLGIHVGEMGPAWAAGRHFMTGISGALAYEAGQADRWFASQVFDPPPCVDRATHEGWPLSGAGLGIDPTPGLYAIARNGREWHPLRGKWESVENLDHSATGSGGVERV